MAHLSLHMGPPTGKAKVLEIHGYESASMPPLGGYVNLNVGGVDLTIHFDHPSQIVNLAGAMKVAAEAFRRDVEPEPACNGEQGNGCDTPPASVYHGQQVQGHKPREQAQPGQRRPHLEDVPQHDRHPEGTISDEPRETWENDQIGDTAELLRRAAQDIALAAGNLNIAAGNVSTAASAVHGLARVL